MSYLWTNEPEGGGKKPYVSPWEKAEPAGGVEILPGVTVELPNVQAQPSSEVEVLPGVLVRLGLSFAEGVGSLMDSPQSAAKHAAGETKKIGGNMLAMTAGQLGDLQSVFHEDRGRLQEQGKALPTSNQLVDKYGDRGHWSYGPSMFASPGPGELKAIAGAVPLAAKAGKNALVNVGDYATTTVGRIRNKTNKEGGYTVQMATGEIPQEGLMVGKYANDSGKNLVLPKDKPLTKAVLTDWVGKNDKALARIENHLGTWRETDTGILYVDLSTRFNPDEIRKATKFGERTNQLAGFNIGTREEFPIGNWDEYIKSPEFNQRMMEMQRAGQEYLKKHPTAEWWDIHGTLFEEIYGRENLEIVAGFMGATAPNTNPTQNVSMMSEYMRRYLMDEDIIQPNWRVPAGTQTRTEGVQIGMEAGRKNNLTAAAEGRIGDLRADKVQQEARALLGDPDAAVFDRWWARISEDAEKGVYTATQEGAFEAARVKYNQYQELYNVVKEAAESQGRTVRDFSADVWTGIRETVKSTDELFGAKYKGSALYGESKGYADIFEDLVQSKADFLGITRAKFEQRLKRGDAELLSLIIGAPLGAHVYEQLLSREGAAESGRMPGTSSHPVNALASGPEI